MAADKALIAGAAKVAGAQSKLDNATLDAFTDLGGDIEEQVQLNLKNLQEQQEANDKAQGEQYASVETNTPDVPGPLVGGPMEHIIRDEETQYTKYGFEQATGFEVGNEAVLNDPVLKEKRKTLETTIAISNRENDYAIESRANYLKNSKGRHIDPTSLNSILATSIYNGEYEWGKNTKTGKMEYTVDGKKYTIAEARAAMDEVSSPDISGDVFKGIQNNTKEAFKGALNDLQVKNVMKNFKRTLDPISVDENGETIVDENGNPLINKQNLKNAETFYIGQNLGISVGALRKQYKDEKQYVSFLSDQIDSYLTSQKNQHYTPPEVPEVEEEDEPEGDTPYFTAQKDMLDKINSSNKLGKDMYRLGKSPAISYYQSTEFEEMLPPALKIAKSEGVVQIQDVTNTNVNHTINPEQSLEYNLSKLIPLLRSKKRN
tara:strand:+ start:383 stop:1678 length:1296 start_codon:yes stop_codon:yes gene_type:complete